MWETAGLVAAIIVLAETVKAVVNRYNHKARGNPGALNLEQSNMLRDLWLAHDAKDARGVYRWYYPREEMDGALKEIHVEIRALNATLQVLAGSDARLIESIERLIESIDRKD